MPTRILLASPVKQSKSILAEFLDSLLQLDTAGLDLDFAFIDDDNDHDLLFSLARSNRNVRVFPGNSIYVPKESTDADKGYLCDENTHHWKQNLINKVAAYKDYFIQLALAEGYDYLFLVDSDLYLHPRTLRQLLSVRKEIVAEVFWTKWEPHLNPLPQVWAGDQYRLHRCARGESLSEEEIATRTAEFLHMLSQPGTYPVGGLGACTLISRHALSLGVSFKEIPNLSLIGEDRHFCVRAAVLGLELYADTHFPPFHIYRESELEGLKFYKENLASGKEQAYAKKQRGSSITLAMLVRNEAGRYLEQVLSQAAQYIDRAVILDDASEDDTAAICERIMKLNGIPLILVSNQEPMFNNEIILRKQLWNLALDTDPNWVLILDADEIFEAKAPKVLKGLAANPDVECYAFRLYDMWTENHYREDSLWQAHKWHRPLMVRNVLGFQAQWRETPQHCGRFPANISQLKVEWNDLRVKHLGWIKAEDKLNKYYRYKKLDPHGLYGIRAQYESILDPRPNLIPWTEQESTLAPETRS